MDWKTLLGTVGFGLDALAELVLHDGPTRDAAHVLADVVKVVRATLDARSAVVTPDEARAIIATVMAERFRIDRETAAALDERFGKVSDDGQG